MIGIVLALLTAAVWAFAAVLPRKRLGESNFFSVALVFSFIGNIILWPVALSFTDLRAVNIWGVLFFVVAGLLAPGAALLLYFKGMEDVGVSVNAAIYATYPMFSSIFAVLLLDEALALENWVGILCIVFGFVYLERSLSVPKSRSKRLFKKGLLIPLLTSLIMALAFIVRKQGLTIYNEPLLGVAIGFTSSLLLYLPLLSFSYATHGSEFLRKGFRLFWKAGVCASLGWVLSFCALSYEKVSTVSSLINTEPLFVLFFAYLYLKKLEPVTSKLILGSLLIVVGATLVSIR